MAPQHQFDYLARHAFPRKTALRYYRLANVVWLWIAFAILLGFIQWRIDLHAPASAFDLKAHDQAALWTFHLCGLAAAGTLAAGIWWYLPRLEILGHCFLTAFILANSVAVLNIDSVVIVLSFVITVSVALASAFRVLFLVKFTPGILSHKPKP